MKLCRLALCVAAMAGALVGCRGTTDEEPPIAVFRNMYDQPRYNHQAFSAFYEDKRVMRPTVEGTMAREMEINPEAAEGRTMDDSAFVDVIPAVVQQRNGGMEGLVERGEGRYDVYCGPCHDGLGQGKGAVIQRANNPAFNPPTFHQDRIRQMPDGQLFQVITYGKNNMPAYGPHMPVDDRWAVVAYVRALQLSQASE